MVVVETRVEKLELPRGELSVTFGINFTLRQHGLFNPARWTLIVLVFTLRQHGLFNPARWILTILVLTLQHLNLFSSARRILITHIIRVFMVMMRSPSLWHRMVLSIPGTTGLFSSNTLEETLLQYAALVVINQTIVLVLLVTTGLISMSFAVLIDMILIILEFIPMIHVPKNVSTPSCMLMTTPSISNLLSTYVLKLISTISYVNHL